MEIARVFFWERPAFPAGVSHLTIAAPASSQPAGRPSLSQGQGVGEARTEKCEKWGYQLWHNVCVWPARGGASAPLHMPPLRKSQRMHLEGMAYVDERTPVFCTIMNGPRPGTGSRRNFCENPFISLDLFRNMQHICRDRWQLLVAAPAKSACPRDRKSCRVRGEARKFPR